MKIGRYLLAALVACAIATPTLVSAADVQLAQAKSDDSKAKSKASGTNPGKALDKGQDKGKAADKGKAPEKGDAAKSKDTAKAKSTAKSKSDTKK